MGNPKNPSRKVDTGNGMGEEVRKMSAMGCNGLEPSDANPMNAQGTPESQITDNVKFISKYERKKDE